MKLICTCKNEKCPDYQKEREIEWDGVSSYKLHLLLKCPSCAGSLTTKKTNITSNEEQKLKSIGSPTIDSMTPQERKQLLKERSNKDFKKNIEPKKKWMDANVLPKMV